MVRIQDVRWSQRSIELNAFFLNDGARYCPRPHWRLNKRAHVRSRTRAGELPTGRLKQPSYAQPNALLPVTALVTSRVVVGFAEGVGVLLRTFDGFFSVDLKSGCVRKIG